MDTSRIGEFEFLNSDGLINDANPTQFRDAYTVGKLQELVRSGVITSDYANKLCLKLPSGSDLRGMYYLEERDIHIFLNITNEGQHIGVFNEISKTYQIVITNDDIDQPLRLSDCRWFNMAINTHGNCNRIKVMYADSDGIYRNIEITDPCCDKRKDKLDSLNFKPKCLPTAKLTPVKGLGVLTAGSYQATLRCYDAEANTTNYAITTQHLKITQGDHRIGEETNFAILLEAFALPEEYTFAEIVIVEYVGGAVRYKVISDVGIGGQTMKFTYTGLEGAYVPDKARDIRNRIRHIFRGTEVAEHMGRPILYNTEPERNWNLQKVVNEIEWRYNRVAVPADEAEYYSSLRAGEFYMFGISFNFLDNRRTKVFPGVNDNVVEHQMLDRCGCRVPNWFIEDTSVQERLESNPPETNELFRTPQSHINERFKLSSTPSEVAPITTQENPNPETVFDTTASKCSCYKCSNDFVRCYKLMVVAVISFINYVGSGWKAFMAYFSSTVEDFVPYEVPDINSEDCCELLDNCVREEDPGIYQNVDTIENDSLTPQDERESLIPNLVGNNDTREVTDKKPDHKLIKSTFQTNEPEGTMRNSNQVSWVVKDGYWQYYNDSRNYEPYLNMNLGAKNPPLQRNLSSNTINLLGPIAGDDRLGDCVPDLTKPIFYSSGKFGYGQSEELYPDTIGRDDCEPIWGDLAGKNVRLFRAPSLTKEPHWYGSGDNVPSQIGPTNNVIDDTWVILTGLTVQNINIPEELLPHLCPEQPYTIYMVPRTEANKSVLSTGLLHDTFEGPIAGVNHLHGKHAVNSFEFYDPSISDGSNTFRRGSASDIPAYLYHSPDVMLYGNRSDAVFSWIDLEIHGDGTRYGQYAEGSEDPGLFGEKINQTGTRQGINLSHYNASIFDGQPKFKCVKAMEFAEHDGDVPANGKFSLPYNNKYRESGMFVEFEGEKEQFSQDALGVYGALDFIGDGASDNSFIGDGIDHFSMIGNARIFHSTMMRYLPRQYGSIVNMNFIPVGLHGTAADYKERENVSASGVIGDSYVGSYAYKRTSVVSDKVYQDISPDTAFGLTNIFRGSVLRYVPGLATALASLATKILRVIGWDDCGVIPPTGDSDNILNQFNLRPGMRALTNTEIGAANVGVPSLAEYSDVYFPSCVSTWIHGIFTSDVVLKYRGTGTIDLKQQIDREDNIAEVHPLNTKTLYLDSTLPDGSDWRYSYMNRFFKKMIEPARIKLIGKAILLAAWVYYIGFQIIWIGIEIVYNGLNSVTFGLSNAVGGILVAIFGGVVAAMGVLWIRHWANTDLDNKIADRLFSIKGCFPDIENSNVDGTLVNGSRYQMKLGKHVRGLEDNYYYYNIDLLRQNFLETEFSPPKNYDTQWCPTEYSTKLIVGNKQNPESVIDAWKNFKPHNFLNIDRNRGRITKVLTVAGRLIVHTTETMFVIGVRDQIVDIVNDAQPLGSQSIFSGASDLFSGVAAGYGGTKDPNAGFVDRTGYYFIDSDARRPMVFTGSNVQEQPFLGLEDFFDENLHFHILEHWPDFPVRDQKCESGVHYDMAIDHNRKIFYLYKKDFKLDPAVIFENGVYTKNGKVIDDIKSAEYFVRNDFTLTYDMQKQRYITKHYWSPDNLFFNRNTMFAKKGDEIYDWTERHRFREFFGERLPMYVDLVIPTIDQKYDVSQVESVKIVGEVLQHNEDGTITELKGERLIDSIMFYNGYQATKWISPYEVNTNSSEDITLMTDEEAIDETDWKDEINGLMINKIQNVVNEGNAALDRYNTEIRTFETSGSEVNKKCDLLLDDYVGVKIYIDKDPSVQVLLRKVIVNLVSERNND